VLLGRCPGDGLVAEPPDGQFELGAAPLKVR
jgi:hypothetical protein